MSLVLAVIVVLILVNALYVAAEFGAVGARRSRIRRLAEDGNRLAARLLPEIDDPRALDRYIAATQIGITLSSLVLGAYAQATLTPLLVPVFARLDRPGLLAPAASAALGVLLGLTAVQMVVGELVPKSLALQYPTRIALLTVRPMRWSLRAFAWFIAVLNGSGTLVLKLFGLAGAGHRHIHSPDEIEMLIAESRDGGLLEPEELARLRSALRLGRRSARDLMVPRERIAALSADTPFDRILTRLSESPYTRLPVYEDTIDRPIGVLHTKDLALACTCEGDPPPLRSLLRPVTRVTADMPADRVLAFLREKRAPLALVMDPGGRVAGLITLEDVVSELLGDVADEFKSGRRGGTTPQERGRA
jgi:CBS domain containing-hemolysin-like protein